MPAHPRDLPLKGRTNDWNGTLIKKTGRGHPNRVYSIEEVERGLTILAASGDNTTRAAELSGFKRETLAYWRKRHPERYEEIRVDLAPQIEAKIIADARSLAQEANEVEKLALDKTREGLEAGTLKDPSAALKNVTTTKAINIDKMLIMQGRPTQIRQTESTDDLMRRLTANGIITGTAEELPQLPEGTQP